MHPEIRSDFVLWNTARLKSSHVLLRRALLCFTLAQAVPVDAFLQRYVARCASIRALTCIMATAPALLALDIGLCSAALALVSDGPNVLSGEYTRAYHSNARLRPFMVRVFLLAVWLCMFGAVILLECSWLALFLDGLTICQFFDVRSKEQRDTAGGTFSLSNKVEAHFVMTLVQVRHSPSVCCVPAPLPARHSASVSGLVIVLPLRVS